MLSEFGGKLDLCFIPTGIDLHAPMAIEAMRAGANAFIEKPAAAVIEDIAAMQAVLAREDAEEAKAAAKPVPAAS